MTQENHVVGGGEVPDSLGAIAVVEEGEERILRLSGDIDSLVVAPYEESPSALAERFRPVTVIDTSAVTFVDGRGLRFLVGRTRDSRRAGGQPVLRRPARVVRHILDAAGAGHLFAITL